MALAVGGVGGEQVEHVLLPFLEVGEQRLAQLAQGHVADGLVEAAVA